MPPTRLITMTLSVTRSKIGLGSSQICRGLARRALSTSKRLATSSLKSSSSQMVSPNSSTRAGGFESAVIGIYPTSRGATQASTRSSDVTFRRIPGRWTFTTTGVPSSSSASWTWAIEADANGRSLIEAKVSLIGPSSRVRTFLMKCSIVSTGT